MDELELMECKLALVGAAVSQLDDEEEVYWLLRQNTSNTVFFDIRHISGPEKYPSWARNVSREDLIREGYAALTRGEKIYYPPR